MKLGDGPGCGDAENQIDGTAIIAVPESSGWLPQHRVRQTDSYKPRCPFFKASVNTTTSGNSRKTPRNNSAAVINRLRTQRGSVKMAPLCCRVSYLSLPLP